MARKILVDTAYTFTPSTATIVIPRYIPRERLILITDVTNNTVLYNFSDTTLKATSYTAVAGQVSWGASAGTTTIVLGFNTNTAAFNATDKLQIMIDEYVETFTPAEALQDPTNKLRVTLPQSLIDTDFEYSFQPTKWEFFQTQNWHASIYTSTSNSVLSINYGGAGFTLLNYAVSINANVGTVTGLSLSSAPYAGSYVYIVDANGTSTQFSNFRYAIASSSTSQFTFPVTGTTGSYTVQSITIGALPGTAANPSYAAFQVSNNITAAGVNLTPGTPILIAETQNEPYCDGSFVAAFVSQIQGAFSYFPKINQQFNANQLQKAQTTAFVGGYYAAGYGIGSIVPISAITTGSDGRTITITTYSNHNFVPGAPIYVGGLQTAITNGNGPQYIQSVPSPYTFTYNVPAGVPTSQPSANVLQNTTVVYARPESFQIQRSGDGGIGIFSGNPVAGARALRQTRRYFRYQAGKGIQFSTSATFKPNFDIASITVSGNIATITTDQDHGLQYGAIVNLRNITAAGASAVADMGFYNNTYSVSPQVVLTARSFGVQLSGSPTDTNPGVGIGSVEVGYATGSCIRFGLFDDQNGFFYEYDGSFLNAVRRNGTTIMRGSINVLTGSTIVIGTGSQYTKQVQAGDKVIIRGQTYEVNQVVNDNVLNITPAYRAATPALASGTAGLPFAYITSGSSTNTATVQMKTTATATSITFTSLVGSGTAGSGGVGVTGAYQLQGTIPQIVATSIPSVTAVNSTTITVASATSIQPGQLVVITGAGYLPANTFVASTYVSGSTVVPLTQGITTATTANIVVAFYNSPASGMNIVATGGSMAQGIIANGTQVSSFTNTAGNNGANLTINLYINQAVILTTTASTLIIGSVPGYQSAALYTTSTQVIGLNTTYGIAPGMTITGSGVPGNCVVAGLAVGGVGVILNTPITTNVTGSLAFQANTTLYALTIATGGSSASSGATTLTMNTVAGIQIGSFVTGTNVQQNTFVTGINTSTNVITLFTPFVTTQGLSGTVSSATNLVFGSRIFVVGATQTNANGMWPIINIASDGSTIQYQTAGTTTGSTVISTYGTTKMFAEDIAVKKYMVRELRTPQFQFNLDTMDGTGPTGFNMDHTKIQMIYIDYTWYGAGFIRWGVRMVNGDIVYAHKVQHGNREYLAFQRSGNLPGRFEAVNAPARSPITVDIPSTGYTMSASPSAGTISLYDASRYFMPSSTGDKGQMFNGEVIIDGELFFYTGVAAQTTQKLTGNPDAVNQNISVPFAPQSTSAPWATGLAGLTAVAQTGTIVVSGGGVTSIPVVSGGVGYTSTPPVNIFGGGGAGAQARAVVVNGSVTQVIVTAAGYGYTSTPTVVIGANQLIGCYRESSVVSSVNSSGAGFSVTTTQGSNAITIGSATIAAQLFVGCTIAAHPAWNYVNVKIVGISGTTAYTNIASTGTSGPQTVFLINRGNPTASQHYSYNNTGNPLSNALNSNILLAPNVQHWGVSAIMDGRFDGDISYVFTTPRQTAAVVQPNQTSPLISMRVSPSSSNGFARNFGVRDVILRMQAKLYQMDVFNAGPFLITVKYNCASVAFTPALWTANSVGSGSLSQVIYHNPSDIVTGGDIILAFYANASGGTFFTSTSADMTVVKDLGNSVFGGDGVFPDGPDVITVFATNLDTRYANPIFSRISWTESQA